MIPMISRDSSWRKGGASCSRRRRSSSSSSSSSSSRTVVSGSTDRGIRSRRTKVGL